MGRNSLDGCSMGQAQRGIQTLQRLNKGGYHKKMLFKYDFFPSMSPHTFGIFEALFQFYCKLLTMKTSLSLIWS